jgi:hypothetical protein
VAAARSHSVPRSLSIKDNLVLAVHVEVDIKVFCSVTSTTVLFDARRIGVSALHFRLESFARKALAPKKLSSKKREELNQE